MGLFEKAGRRFEQFKQKATSAAEEQADYECYACGHRFYADGDECPECGSEAVAPAEDDGETSAADAESPVADAGDAGADEADAATVESGDGGTGTAPDDAE